MVSLTDDDQVLLAGERSPACEDEMLGLSAGRRSQASRWNRLPTASSKRSWAGCPGEERSDEEKVNPDLVPWVELPKQQKGKREGDWDDTSYRPDISRFRQLHLQ